MFERTIMSTTNPMITYMPVKWSKPAVRPTINPITCLNQKTKSSVSIFVISGENWKALASRPSDSTGFYWDPSLPLAEAFFAAVDILFIK